MSAKKTTRRRAVEPEPENVEDEQAAAGAGGHICGWCITRDCDNCRVQTGRWACTCDHSRRLPPPAEFYGEALMGMSDIDHEDGDEFV